MPNNLLGLLNDPDLAREYCKFPSLLLREINGYSDLPPKAMALWQDFFEMTKFKSNRSVEISINRLSKIIGRSRRSVEDYIQKLEENGFIKREANYSNIGGRLANTFLVLIPSTIIEKIRNSNKKVFVSSDLPKLKTSEVLTNTYFEDRFEDITDCSNEQFLDHESDTTPDISTNTAPPPAENCAPLKEAKEVFIELDINNNTVDSVDIFDLEKSNVVFEKEVRQEKKLSKWQLSYLMGMLKKVQEAGVRLTNPKEIFDQVSFSILSDFQFKGSDFKKKVNCISKLLRGGNWKTPIGFYNHDKQGQEHRARYQELAKPQKYDLEGLQHFESFFDGAKVPIFMDGWVRKDSETIQKEEKISLMEGQIKRLEEKICEATDATKGILLDFRKDLFSRMKELMDA